jgi:hypothetical protein
MHGARGESRGRSAYVVLRCELEGRAADAALEERRDIAAAASVIRSM